ncbi:MAG: hypothetical protein V4628_16570 [Pseudomonadota bacterium]
MTVTNIAARGIKARLNELASFARNTSHVLAPLFVVVTLALMANEAAAEIPRSAEGHPDFSGIWQTLGNADSGLEAQSARKDAPPHPGIVEGGTIPYKPAALAQRDKNFAARETADPAKQCFSLGTPRGVYYPEPFQIFQRDRDLTLLFQLSHRARTIHTNDSLHPEGPIGFWFGDSRAKWEGDTLVVDVVDFTADTWLDHSGNFHSEQLHVTERWSFLDENTLQYSATLEDPEVYTKPWNINVLLYRHREPNFQIIENTCYTLDYDQYYPVPESAQATPSS